MLVFIPSHSYRTPFITYSYSLMSVVIDVFQHGPEVLRRLRERFYNKISSLERRRLCDEVCRQTPEKFREDRATISRAECGHDAVRTATRSMIPKSNRVEDGIFLRG